MSASDVVVQIKALADAVAANPGKYTDVLAKAQDSVQNVANMLGALKAGNTDAVKTALTQWDDVNQLLDDADAIDALNKGSVEEKIVDGAEVVLADTGKVLAVAAQVAPLVLKFGPLLGLAL